MVDDDGGGLRERLMVRERERKGDSRDSCLIWEFFNLYAPDLVGDASRDIHLIGFGAGKPRVEVGHAMCEIISLFYFFVSHVCFFCLLADSKDLNVTR